LIEVDDKTLYDRFFGGEAFIPTPVLLELRRTVDLWGIGTAYESPWWPNKIPFLNNDGLDDFLFAAEEEWLGYIVSGTNGRLSIRGVSRDQYGSPLGGCTIRLFLTSTGEMVSTVTSDANGAYIITSPYSASHFLTVHAPGVGGASIDSIVPI
jgi:hypothetical protein